jgi:hypothetical protein
MNVISSKKSFADRARTAQSVSDRGFKQLRRSAATMRPPW